MYIDWQKKYHLVISLSINKIEILKHYPKGNLFSLAYHNLSRDFSRQESHLPKLEKSERQTVEIQWAKAFSWMTGKALQNYYLELFTLSELLLFPNKLTWDGVGRAGISLQFIYMKYLQRNCEFRNGHWTCEGGLFQRFILSFLLFPL